MKKNITVILICTVIGWSIGIIIEKNQSFSFGNITTNIKALRFAPTPTLTPRPGIPQTLVIPALNISVPVESVGKDENGQVGIPINIYNTAWYNLSVRPGEAGNAVIDGHFDTPTGEPSVFYNLHTLQEDNEISVIDNKGDEHRFRVTGVSIYNISNFPMEEVFGWHEKSRLNLITCAGVWDSLAKNYTDRAVVFSEKIN